MGEEPDAKRQRTDFKLQAEDEFLEAHPGGSTVRVQAPALEDSDTLNGQVRGGGGGAPGGGGGGVKYLPSCNPLAVTYR